MADIQDTSEQYVGVSLFALAHQAGAGGAASSAITSGGKNKGKKEKKEKKEKKPNMWNAPGTKKKKSGVLAAGSGSKEFVNTTPPGEKKDMTAPMADKYNPIAVESAWDSWWEAQGYYTVKDVEAAAKAPADQKFVMVIPPPNVTGTLHLGHALTCSVEDTLARWHRMCGKYTLWLPGIDHAGIATQSVVERMLWKEKKQTRHDLGRKDFVDRVWAGKRRKVSPSSSSCAGSVRRWTTHGPLSPWTQT